MYMQILRTVLLVCRELLEAELEAVGIRLNKRKPNIYFKQKKGGGIKFTATLNLTKCDEKMIQNILHDFSILFSDPDWHPV